MNSITIIGNLTKDIEKTETQSGVSVARFSVAVRRNYKDADGNYPTDFINCTAWRNLADTLARYAHKGDKICVQGSMESRSYEDREGNKRVTWEVLATNAEFLSPVAKSEETPKKSERGLTKTKLQSFEDDGDIPF